MASWRVSACLSLIVFFSSLVNALKGDTWCGRYMCIQAYVNDTSWTFQMEANIGENGFGWMAIGFGTSMTDSKMVIMWPNRDGSVTLSQRTASAHSEPKVDGNPPKVASTFLPLSAQTTDRTQLAFTIAPDSNTMQRLVWAIATTRPPTGDVDTQLTQHIASGGITLDLSREFSTPSDFGPTPTGNGDGISYRPPTSTYRGGNNLPKFELPPLLPYQRMLMAHAALSAIGFLVVLPFGALIGRWGRVYTNKWFKLHWICQAGVGLPAICTGWALAVAGVHKKEGTHFDDLHKVVGLVLFGAYILQMLLGLHIHLFKPHANVAPRPIPLSAVSGKKGQYPFTQLLATSTRPFLNYLHPVFGIVIIVTAFWNVYRGLSHEWEVATGRGVAPTAVKRLWIAWAAFIPAAYFIGLALLPRQLAQERKVAQVQARGSDALPLKPSVPSVKTYKGLKISPPIPINEEEEWKRNDGDATTEAGHTTMEAMSEDSHAAHTMQPVRWARVFE